MSEPVESIEYDAMEVTHFGVGAFIGALLSLLALASLVLAWSGNNVTSSQMYAMLVGVAAIAPIPCLIFSLTAWRIATEESAWSRFFKGMFLFALPAGVLAPVNALLFILVGAMPWAPM